MPEFTGTNWKNADFKVIDDEKFPFLQDQQLKTQKL